tara:strand:- start:28 stop:204 length:177 start_codon:yes stop_codon:yes gene_type:complete
MTFTEKMILSGILLFLTMFGLIRALEKNSIEPYVFIDYLALIGVLDAIAFSSAWIWSQ